MSDCRNQLMNEGKPYPRSGCNTCGSMLGPGKLVCSKGVKPNDPTQAKYYIPTALENPEEARFQYAVIVKESYSEAGYDPGDPSETVYYDKFIPMTNLAALKNWLTQNQASRYSSKEVKRVIKYQELKVSTEVVINIG